MNDLSGKGTFDFHTFQAILSKVGIFLPRQELSKLYRKYDVIGKESLDYRVFIADLVGEVNARRQALIEKLFNTLSGGESSLRVSTLVNQFNSAKHPRVLSGHFTEKEVFTEFFNSFEGAVPGKSGLISKQEFVDYYTDFSSSIPSDDDAFAKVVLGVWGVAENAGASPAAVAAQKRAVKGVRDMIADKIQQRSKAGGSETDTLRKCFKTFDLDDEGRLDSRHFFEALSVFGIRLDTKTQDSFFASLEQCPDGKVDYTAFSHSIFGSNDSNEGFLLAAPPSSTNTNTSRFAASARTTNAAQKDKAAVIKTAVSSAAPSVQAPVESKSAPTSTATSSSSSAAPTDSAAAAADDDDFPAVLFLLGAPCSGKSEQGHRLAAQLGFAHIETQALLQQALADKSNKYSSIISKALESGAVVPVEVVIAVIRDAMNAQFKQGFFNFVIDGFPRNKSHLTAWNELMGKYCKPPAFVLLDCHPNTLMNRASNDGIPQDQFELMCEAFNKETMVLCEWLAVHNRLSVVHGDDDSDTVFAHIVEVIDAA